MNGEWLNPSTVYLLFHILGTAIGAGAAFTGDLIFMTSVRNKILTSSELRILTTTSRMVWVGILILVMSGIGLVLQRPEIFLNSDKFWTKMTVLFIIILNGLVFHFVHFPIIKNSIGGKFTAKTPLIQKRALLVTSGAISLLSWNYVIVLGVLGRTPFSYVQFFGLYVVLFLLACLGAFLLKKRLISTS